MRKCDAESQRWRTKASSGGKPGEVKIVGQNARLRLEMRLQPDQEINVELYGRQVVIKTSVHCIS